MKMSSKRSESTKSSRSLKDYQNFRRDNLL
jgi:hypothetical protein